MTPPSVVVFAMPLRGHFNRLLPLIAGLVDAGATVHVLTHESFRELVSLAGAQFVDLFKGRSVESIDSTSVPWAARYVSFAGHHGSDIAKEVRGLQPRLVVHDTFAVVGQVVANHLGISRVAVCSGHNLVPAQTVEAVHRDVAVHISDACWRGVQALRELHGMPDASPFSYVSALSRDLNVYCEPPQFLPPAHRHVFEPICFFGSLWPDKAPPAAARRPFGTGDTRGTLRVYASFGTVIWRYYEDTAIELLGGLAEVLSDLEDAELLVSLGDAGPMARAARFAGPNVRVEPYVDQWDVLREASVYVTHQGLNSTHEAIFHRVPMISYPFFWDQPALAARCRDLGISLPLVDVVRAPVGADRIRAALVRVASEREQMKARLEEVRCWELETIEARGTILKQILELAK